MAHTGPWSGIRVETIRTYAAFLGERRVAGGSLEQTVSGLKAHLDAGGAEALVFEDQTGRQLEFDLRGSLEEALERARQDFAPTEGQAARAGGPGRPKLGVVSREVSLLPRHWEWLEQQMPGGASAGLRRLVEQAMKSGTEQAKRAREATSKFMWAMTGNQPHFEEATRALFAKDQARLERLIEGWPHDLRAHVLTLSREAARLDASAT